MLKSALRIVDSQIRPGAPTGLTCVSFLAAKARLRNAEC